MVAAFASWLQSQQVGKCIVAILGDGRSTYDTNHIYVTCVIILTHTSPNLLPFAQVFGNAFLHLKCRSLTNADAGQGHDRRAEVSPLQVCMVWGPTKQNNVHLSTNRLAARRHGTERSSWKWAIGCGRGAAF